MVIKNVWILTCFLLCGVSAFAEGVKLSHEATEALGLNSAQVLGGHRIMINDDISVRVYKNLNAEETTRRDVFLPRGTELEVIETSADGKIARVGMDTEDTDLSDLFVSVADIERARLSEVETSGDEIDLAEADIEEGLFARRKRRSGMTYCYRDVKNTLLRVRKCRRYASGAQASQAYSILARECNMRQVGNPNPRSLPAYSVCVSGGGRVSGCSRGGCGHIAVKLPSGIWFGAGYRGSPYLPNSSKRGYRSRYKIGCLVPR